MPTASSPAASPSACDRSRRRSLRFDSVDAVLAEADRLAAAEAAGRLDHCGNWTLGQTLNHLATWAEYPYVGYPASVSVPPLVVRMMARLLRRKILYGRMMPGMRIGRVPGGTLGAEDVPTAGSLPRLRVALARLAEAAPTGPNPALGALTHDEWVQLNLRHAELHFSFQLPG